MVMMVVTIQVLNYESSCFIRDDKVLCKNDYTRLVIIIIIIIIVAIIVLVDVIVIIIIAFQALRDSVLKMLSPYNSVRLDTTSRRSGWS